MKPGTKCRLRLTEVDRFWSKVRPEAGDKCWLWAGSRKPAGYGEFRQSNNGRLLYAHRYSYELAFGPIPRGMLVCHRCDNPPCCNPEHLFLGTMADNIRDASRKGRLSRGSARHNAKLDECAVREIRRRVRSGERQCVLAREFGVSDGLLSEIIGRTVWAHVEDC